MYGPSDLVGGGVMGFMWRTAERRVGGWAARPPPASSGLRCLHRSINDAVNQEMVSRCNQGDIGAGIRRSVNQAQPC